MIRLLFLIRQVEKFIVPKGLMKFQNMGGRLKEPGHICLGLILTKNSTVNHVKGNNSDDHLPPFFLQRRRRKLNEASILLFQISEVMKSERLCFT